MTQYRASGAHAALASRRAAIDDLRDIPAGRSWFHSIRVGLGVTIIEHRVPAKVFGGEAAPARDDYVQRHEGLTHAEGVRLKRKLYEEGLFYAGGPL